MNYFFLLLLLLSIGCSGQQDTKKQEKIDTSKLFNPTGHENIGSEDDMKIFTRAVAVYETGYTAILNEKQRTALKNIICSLNNKRQKYLDTYTSNGT